MAKKIPKKKSQSKNEYKEKVMKIKKKRQLVNLALGALLVLIIISSLVILLKGDIDLPFFKKISSVFPEEEKYAVIVNQEPVTLDEFNERYEQIPPQYKDYITKDNLLDQIIDEKLLLAKANEMGIIITDEEINEYMTNLTTEAGVTIEDFEAMLSENGLTLDDAKIVYKRSMTLNQVVQQLVFSDLEISEIDISDYYNKNIETFKTPESINVSHILVCHNESERCESELSKEESLVRANEIIELIDEDNFASIALEYSDEPAAQQTLGNLGWVNREIPFDQDFLDASFELEVGEISEPVETIFGYHIITVFETRPEETLELDTVKNAINQTLLNELQSGAYIVYMEGMRNKTEIIYFDLEGEE
ncbi:hypothetical protein HN789_06385 [archaeon]|nr:hypothetical protein [archaeon]MBT4022809.1 hypothetical protein [archaeon]MBT4272997.1 hypothetical protein [archaeon]MBT4460912.1 hypothetical protein [archaeon]MBT4858128.1 hypothetical protein [archaeon]